MRTSLILVGASALVWACAGKSIEIGPGAAGAGGRAGSSGTPATGGAPGNGGSNPGRPLPSWPDPSACVAASNLPLTGLWNGYQENAPTTDPFNHIRLDIHGASEAGGLCGTMTIGTGSPPPPATNADIGYPPGLQGGGGGPPFIEGFPFTLIDGTVDSDRVRFNVAYNEPWRGWCRLQTPVADEVNPGDYHCMPNWGSVGDGSGHCWIIDPHSNQRVSVDCGKLMLCSSQPTCTCNATACDANDGFNVGTFDIHFDAASGDGSASNQRVRFFRAD